MAEIKRDKQLSALSNGDLDSIMNRLGIYSIPYTCTKEAMDFKIGPKQPRGLLMINDITHTFSIAFLSIEGKSIKVLHDGINISIANSDANLYVSIDDDYLRIRTQRQICFSAKLITLDIFNR